jgi:hypothetical protein
LNDEVAHRAAKIRPHEQKQPIPLCWRLLAGTSFWSAPVLGRIGLGVRKRQKIGAAQGVGVRRQSPASANNFGIHQAKAFSIRLIDEAAPAWLIGLK